MNLPHHSASSINSFISYRHQYIGSKILKNRFPNNPSFARGKAVEEGVASHLCRGETTEESVKIAEAYYIQESADLVGEDKTKFTHQIGPMVQAGCDHYDQIIPFMNGSPEEQVKVTTDIQESHRILLGYLDLSWPDAIHDLKTASKTPSALSQGYIIQGAVYKLATGKPVTFTFIIPLKNEVKVKAIKLSDEDFTKGLKIIRATVRQMDIILDNCPEREDMTPAHVELYKALAYPDLNGIWNPTERAQVMESLDTYNV